MRDVRTGTTFAKGAERWRTLGRLLPCLALFPFSFACTSTSSSRSSSESPPDGGLHDRGTPDGGLDASLVFPPPPPVPPLDCSDDSTDWPFYGQNVCNTFTTRSDRTIAAQTAPKLGVKWSFAAAGDVSATPAVVGGQVYFPDWGGMMNRIDGATGQAVWSKSVADLAGLGAGAGEWEGGAPDQLVSRGTPLVTGGMVVFGIRRGTFDSAAPMAYLVAIDQDTGALRWKTLLDSHVAAIVTAAPVVEGGIIYVGVASMEEDLSIVSGYSCCSFRGSVAAVDATTGNVVWQTPMIEDSVYFQSDGVTPSGAAGAAIWSGAPAVDRKRHSLYVTTGNPYSLAPGVSPAPDGDHVESIVALDLGTGAIKWASRMLPATGDVWTFADPQGPDSDFGGGANLFSAQIGGTVRDLVGAGQKSGVYWAVDADTGNVVWHTQVGPGGHLGGIQWGTAVDGWRVYAGVNNTSGAEYTLGGAGAKAGGQTKVGSWAALDPGTGKELWQVADPALTTPLLGASVNSPVVAVNGVLFGGSMDATGTMYALDGTSGAVLWSFQSGGTVYGSPAVSGGVVYWGCGFPPSRCIHSVSGCHGLGFGTPCSKLYAFEVKAGATRALDGGAD